MTDLRDLLVDADPLGTDAGLNHGEAQAMRRRIMTASAEQAPRALVWDALLAAVPLAVVLIFGSALHQTITSERTSSRTVAINTADDATRTRQIYFQTAGGTRVIWILTPDSKEGQR